MIAKLLMELHRDSVLTWMTFQGGFEGPAFFEGLAYWGLWRSSIRIKDFTSKNVDVGGCKVLLAFGWDSGVRDYTWWRSLSLAKLMIMEFHWEDIGTWSVICQGGLKVLLFLGGLAVEVYGDPSGWYIFWSKDVGWLQGPACYLGGTLCVRLWCWSLSLAKLMFLESHGDNILTSRILQGDLKVLLVLRG